MPANLVVSHGMFGTSRKTERGETFERRVLTLGASDGTRTQVVAGIRPGEMVVTTGAYQVRLASMSSTPMSGGHAH